MSNAIPDDGCENECDPRTPPHCSEYDQNGEEREERSSEDQSKVCSKVFHGIAPDVMGRLAYDR